MFTRSTFSVLMLVGLLAESGAASAQEYCVACSEPDAVYRCIIEGAQPGGAQPLQVMCITAMAKAGNHATCGVKSGTVFQCDGPVRRVPWTASGESQPLNPQAQKSDSKPSDPNEPPKTMLEPSATSETDWAALRPDGRLVAHAVTLESERTLLAFHAQTFFLRQAFGAVTHHFVDVLQTRDRLGNGFPVGQRATEPAVVHVILRALFSSVGDSLGRLTLGADEEDAAVLGHGLTDHVQSRVEHRDGLRQVDDVDAVAVAVDVFAHPRVPALGLVAVVNASFKKLTHGKFRKRHALFLSGLRLSGMIHPRGGNRWTYRDFSPASPHSACEVPRV